MYSMEKTLTTARRFGRNATSNSRDAENRYCTVCSLAQGHKIRIAELETLHQIPEPVFHVLSVRLSMSRSWCVVIPCNFI